ncbi:unnamed protein product [Paramecium primaurelia]|uniref:UDENN domain-containing protein n=1 Tax=Paramecium primaurelia TaxID=5886 RepID=A0A8S1QDN8_PARPR|nr:unnamed protein product [Paramecium primaurelia]
MLPSHPSPVDKDKKIKIMDELIKTNQKHIDHLKQTITQLKRQLQFEQKRNQDLDKDNTMLKDQIKKLLSKPPLHTQSTQTSNDIHRRDSRQLSTKEDQQFNSASKNIQKSDNDQVNQVNQKQQILNQISPTKQEIKKIQKLDLKIDINSALQRQQSGPISSVKKSQTYLHGLTNVKLIDAIKERIPEKSNRIGQITGDRSSQIRRSLMFNFQNNKSTIIDCELTEEQEIQKSRNSDGKQQQLIESIEEYRVETMEVSALQQSAYKLYEKFYIMGCEKKEFLEFDNDPNIKEGILPANILFKSDSIDTPVYEEIINGFVYPFGNQVEKIKVNDSFRKLKEIMYSGNKYELLDKFSLFTIKNQENNDNLSEHTNQNLLNQANPEKLLYGICLSVYDFIETTPDHIKLTFENRKKRIFWKYKKTYCFLTYFPFYELFQDLLISIINLIKINRTDRYLKKYSEEYEVLKDVDGQQIILEFQDELTKFLNLIQVIKPMLGHQQLELQTLAGTLKYRIPNQLQLDIELRLWSANVTLQILNYKEILNIFLAMISEISIIFVCEKSNILTSIIHFFHHIVRPLEWTQGIIYNVPEQLLTMIQSPVPIIIGVNLTESDFNLMSLADNCENHLFVFLDRDKESKFLTKPQNVLKDISTPSFGGLLQQIETILKNQNNIRNPSPSIRQVSNKNDDKKVIKFYFDDQDQNKSKKVLETFKKIIEDYIISKLPSQNENRIKVGQDLNYQFIEQYLIQSSDPKDKKFIQNLFKTQHFQYFIQQHYCDQI